MAIFIVSIRFNAESGMICEEFMDIETMKLCKTNKRRTRRNLQDVKKSKRMWPLDYVERTHKKACCYTDKGVFRCRTLSIRMYHCV